VSVLVKLATVVLSAVRGENDGLIWPHLLEDVTVKALDEVEEWGPSDHCRLLIDLDR